MTRQTATGGTISYTYNSYQTDHLGSVDSVYVSGAGLEQKTNFDPFGARRQSDWSADISTTALSALETVEMKYERGFTGHEQRLQTGFVHMNGRVYDPEIGRFVSSDPFVTDPTNGQSYNRYSYVVNSPLSFVNPTGFVFWSSDEPFIGERTPLPALLEDRVNTWLRFQYAVLDGRSGGSIGFSFGLGTPSGTIAGASVTEIFESMFNDVESEKATGQRSIGSAQQTNEPSILGFLGSPEFFGALSRAGSIIGGGAQVFAGGALCVGSGGLACAGGAVLIGLGADNLTEGFTNNSVQPLRSALGTVIDDSTTVDLVHAGVNVTSSAAAAFRQIPKTGLIGIGESRTQAAITRASKHEIGIELGTTTSTIAGPLRND